MATKIEWTDETWNPVRGCTKVSPGCDNCYAERVDNRWNGPGSFDTVRLQEKLLNKPLTWKNPRKVFVNSMSDLFHDAVPDEYIAKVWQVMAATPQHTYQILTKRHARMRSWLTRWNAVLTNVWLGVSVEDQQRAELRIPALVQTPAAVRFLSCEPLLGPVDLRNLRAKSGALVDCLGGDVKSPEDGAVYAGTPSIIDWVIVGGESGPGARPMHPDWARSLRDQCQGRAAFHFKQWGAWALGGNHGQGEDGPGDTFVNPDGSTGHAWFSENLGYPTNHSGPWNEDSQLVSRVGKKRAGRELDGRTWDEFPRSAMAGAR